MRVGETHILHKDCTIRAINRYLPLHSAIFLGGSDLRVLLLVLVVVVVVVTVMMMMILLLLLLLLGLR